MLLLKNSFFLLCVMNFSCLTITAGQKDEDRLLGELDQLVQLDTELRLNVLQPGTRLWLNQDFVSGLRFSVYIAMRERAVRASQQMFIHKGKYTDKDDLAFQKFLNECTDDFMLFDLPPAVSIAGSAMNLAEERTPPLTCLSIVTQENLAAKKENAYLYSLLQKKTADRRTHMQSHQVTSASTQTHTSGVRAPGKRSSRSKQLQAK